MKVSDIMTTNVVSIASSISLAEARKVMEANNYHRLPVIDRGKLVGIVTKDNLEKMGPSKLSSFDFHELAYMLNTIKVKDVMHKNVVTAPPDTYIDDAIDLVQTKRVGMLVVVEDDFVVGIATTKDIFFKIVNPIFGVRMPGTRIYVQDCSEASNIAKVMDVIKNFAVVIISQFSVNIPEFRKRSLVLQLDGANTANCIEAIKKLGFEVIVKAKK
jgi:acetoin utilization protein AcuB